MLFKALDRQAWKESGHNPDKMLRELPRELLEKAAADTDYIHRYDDVMDVFGNYMQQKECHLIESVSLDHKFAVAYFSAEYSLHRSLPFYAGGFGFLAGDYLKQCSDLYFPLMVKEYIGKFYSKCFQRTLEENNGF